LSLFTHNQCTLQCTNHSNKPSGSDQDLQEKSRDKGVFLTYAAKGSGDGLGAQAQRLLGIYSASRELNFGYLHTPILSIEVNPGDPHTTQGERIDYLRRVNDFFCLPSDTAHRPNRTFRLRSLSPRNLKLLKIVHRLANAFGLSVFVELPSSLPWSDKHPDTYNWGSSIVKSRMPARNQDEKFRIDLHIRRAVAPELGRDGKPYDRYVPTSWYEDILKVIVEFLKSKDVPYMIRIHTDIPKSRWKVPEDTTSGTLEMWRHHNFVDEDGFLYDMGEDLDEAFAGYGEIEVARDWDPLDALKSMSTTDILVMCASSLSYVAGLTRGRSWTISPPFFHSPLSDWSEISRTSSDLAQAELRARLDQMWSTR
jgi:hypothetical protein